MAAEVLVLILVTHLARGDKLRRMRFVYVPLACLIAAGAVGIGADRPRAAPTPQPQPNLPQLPRRTAAWRAAMVIFERRFGVR